MEPIPIQVALLAHDFEGKAASAFPDRAPVVTVCFDTMRRGQ
jgi:hypothetical protein